ncbi:MAG: hypothetical protein WC666_01585 [Candidatus Paceibacterota bacterium]
MRKSVVWSCVLVLSLVLGGFLITRFNTKTAPETSQISQAVKHQKSQSADRNQLKLNSGELTTKTNTGQPVTVSGKVSVVFKD